MFKQFFTSTHEILRTHKDVGIIYEGRLKVKKNVYVPDEEDVDAYLDEVRRQSAELRTVETGFEEDHLL
tara:strand:- start:217 stop:423 length:207 start_codon:yes stop_codon:yes gene_type:complete